MTQFSFFRYFVFAMIFVGVVFANNVFAANNGILSVTNISAVKTYATADGIFENGWQWVFDVTVPYNETILKMKFADWSGGTNAIPAADNIRFYSAQSTDANSASTAVIISNAGQYSAVMNINPESASDLDFAKAGRQIKIIVEARVPKGSAGGSYSTSYGIFTDIDPDISIVAPGQEGYMIISVNPIPADNILTKEGDQKVAVYSAKIMAFGSDMDVQRMFFKFNVQPYAYFNRIYLYDGDTEIVSLDLNSDTIFRVSAVDYQVNLSNFTNRFVVPKGDVKVLTVKLDVLSDIPSELFNGRYALVAVGMPSSASIRAVDGAGINQYGGITFFPWDPSTYKTINVEEVNFSEPLPEYLKLSVSVNPNSPKSRNIIADANQYIVGATLMTFDLKAVGDSILIDQINDVIFSTGDSYQVPDAAYLVDDGGAVIAVATPNYLTGLTNFTDLNYKIIKDTTKTFSIKVDDRLSVPEAITRVAIEDGKKYAVSINSGNNILATLFNGAVLGDSNKVGAVISSPAYIYAEGPVFTLTSISTTNTQAPYSGASSTMSATFNIQVTAVTGDVYMDKSNAFNVEFSKDATNSTASHITYVQPTNTVAVDSVYKISEGNTATFAVTATIVNGGVAGTYDLRIAGITWGHVEGNLAKVSDYMNGEAAWISPAVYLR